MVDTAITQIIIDALEDKFTNMNFQVAAYIELMEKIRDDGSISLLTRCAYERYYDMTQARLSLLWKNRYFEIFDDCLKNKEKTISFENLMKEVGPDGNCVQFSFISKLFHTLKNEEPIYDKYIRDFLEISTPSGKKPEDREKSAVKIYNNEIKVGFYDNCEYAELRDLMLDLFTERFPNVSGVSKNKKIDFVCWALGKKKMKISVLVDLHKKERNDLIAG